MKKFKNTASWQFDKKTMQETPKGASLTVQGEVITIADMLRRLHNGIPLQSVQGVYGDIDDDDHEAQDLEKFGGQDIVDRIDQMNEAEEVAQRYEELKKKKPKKEDQKEIFEEKKEAEEEEKEGDLEGE